MQVFTFIWSIALRLYRGRDINKFSRPLTWDTGAFVISAACVLMGVFYD